MKIPKITTCQLLKNQAEINYEVLKPRIANRKI